MRRVVLLGVVMLGLFVWRYGLDVPNVEAVCVYDSDCLSGESCIGGTCVGGGGTGGCQRNSDCNEAAGETCQNGVCVVGSFCGNGTCDAGETYRGCPADCASATVEDCGPAISCTGGILRCSPGCSITPRSCWEECPVSGGWSGSISCQGQPDPIQYCYDNAGSVNCGGGGSCGAWACGPTGCYSDCSSCSNPGGFAHNVLGDCRYIRQPVIA